MPRSVVVEVIGFAGRLRIGDVPMAVVVLLNYRHPALHANGHWVAPVARSLKHGRGFAARRECAASEYQTPRHLSRNDARRKSLGDYIPVSESSSVITFCASLLVFWLCVWPSARPVRAWELSP